MKTRRPDIESATRELRALMREAEELLAEKSHDANAKMHHLNDRLGHFVDVGRERALRVKEVTQQQLHQADDYVRTHPYQAVGIAAGVGALIGLIMAHRRAA